jgi:hypothetical protein
MALPEEKRKRDFLPPGVQQVKDTASAAKDAYKKGGLSSAAGIVANRLPGDIAKAARDTFAPSPVREFIGSAVKKEGQAVKNFATAAVTGKVSTGDTATKSTNGTAVAGEIPKTGTPATNLPPYKAGGEVPPYAKGVAGAQVRQFVNPPINEKPSAQRDAELGEMTSSVKATEGGGEKRTYDIGGNTMSYDVSEKDMAIKRSIEDIDNRIAQGFKPTPEQAQRIQEIKLKAGATRGGTDIQDSSQPGSGPRTFKRGNLDIQFDESTDPEAQKRFLENPVRPTAQIDRYNNQRSFSQGQAASANAERILSGGGNGQQQIRTFGDIVQAKHDMAQDRQAETGRNNAAQNSIAATRAQNDFTVANQRNNIDAITAEGQAQEQQAVIANNRFDLNQKQQVAQLEQAYVNAKTDDERKVLERQLYAIKGKAQPKQQFVTVDKFNDLGEKTGQEVMTTDENGNLVPAQMGSSGEQAPLPAEKDLIDGQIYQLKSGPRMWSKKMGGFISA